MVRIVLLLLLLLFVRGSLLAQKSIDGLINAEKSFAAYSAEHSTKEAFLKFLDSNGIVFDQGTPVNGIEYWTKKEKRPGILNWYPQSAEISISKDFGYTTGPWTFQQTLQDSVIARGQYSTIWHIDKNGEWKFIIDLGVSNTPSDTNTQLWNKTNYPVKRRGSLRSLLKAEKKFVPATKNSVRRAYIKNMSHIAILNRNNQKPQEGTWSWDTFREGVQYTITGSGIASSGDLGYVYGTTIINNKIENYLRIWRKEKGGWKIALEVLRY